MTQAQPWRPWGAMWILASAACFTLMTTIIKMLSQYPAPVHAFYSAVASLVIMAPTILRSPRRAFATSRLALMIGRCFLSVGGVTLAYYSYQALPLADANALSFTRALWITPFAALLLRERVGPAHWLSLLIGFAGVLLVLRPESGGGVGLGHAAALVSAMMIALVVTGIKSLSRDHGPAALLSWSAVLGVFLTAPGALLTWQAPDPADLMLLALMGASSVGAQACYIKGMALGDAAALAPIDYARLLFAVVVGVTFFQETPDALGIAGMALIVLSTAAVTLIQRPPSSG